MLKLSGNLIPLYNTAPTGKILFEEIESLINIRDNILHLIEIKSQVNQGENKYNYIKSSLQQHEAEIGWKDAMENDKTSHFILSLAFCKSEQERVWFAALESKLFMARLSMYEVDLEEVLKLLNIPLERQDNVSESLLEKIKFREKSNSTSNNLNSAIYRIPFEYALNLIPTMHYFLNKGFVYISKFEIYHLIETVFKENMIKKLIQISRNLDRVMSDTRISYLIRNFQSRREVETLSKSFNNLKTENISFKDIDAQAERSFPLCMQLVNRHITTNAHLMHNGRLQYGLFLKGIGLSLEESINFWKNKFSKKTPEDKFEKQYAYSIRHNYGKEGKRNDYVPWSCSKIQNLPPPNSNEFHGCPFKVYSEEKLRSLLFDMKFKELDVYKILEKKKNNEFSVRIYFYIITRLHV
jgi:DNA primase large subunit